MTLLEQLRNHSGIVADSSDLETFSRYAPLSGVTTNPTLILEGINNNSFPDLVYEAVKRAKQETEDSLQYAQDWLLVLVADKLTEYVNGRISIEIDARLSFDTEATWKRGYRLIEMADQLGIKPEQLLIKIASTWEGIQAARQLEVYGIGCNMTLLFDLYQAVACAKAQATLISPFVGRIYDWYRQQRQVEHIPEDQDPGIESVKRIYSYYKTNNIKTLVMAASFRTIGQIEHLAGCDLLTISPTLLHQLDQEHRQLAGAIDEYQSQDESVFTRFDKQAFHEQLYANAMAYEKLHQGIEKFAADQRQLEHKLKTMLTERRSEDRLNRDK